MLGGFVSKVYHLFEEKIEIFKQNAFNNKALLHESPGVSPVDGLPPVLSLRIRRSADIRMECKFEQAEGFIYIVVTRFIP